MLSASLNTFPSLLITSVFVDCLFVCFVGFCMCMLDFLKCFFVCFVRVWWCLRVFVVFRGGGC